MRVIIAGSRLGCTPAEFKAAVERSGLHFDEVVSGHCLHPLKSYWRPSPEVPEPLSVDERGERWAAKWGIPLRVMPADWDGVDEDGKPLGKRAGPRRNRAMAEYAAQGPGGGALLLIWDGQSRGSLSMWCEAWKAGILIREHRIPRIGGGIEEVRASLGLGARRGSQQRRPA